MGFWDQLSDFWFGPGRGATNKVLAGSAGQVGAGPGNSYEQMLRDMAEGRGPSLADQQYRRAAGDAMSGAAALSRGRGPGAARSGMTQYGQVAQGLASGSAEARTREQMGAINAGAGLEQQRLEMEQRRQIANQQAYMQALGMSNQQGGIGQGLAGLAGQGLGAYAMLRRPRGPGGGGQSSFQPGDLPELVQPWSWGQNVGPWGS